MTQLQQIEQHLKVHGKITSWGAITAYHITRLSHYILVLRKKGWNIESVRKSDNDKNWTEYQLKNYQ